jgi:hypothetical protein
MQRAEIVEASRLCWEAKENMRNGQQPRTHSSDQTPTITAVNSEMMEVDSMGHRQADVGDIIGKGEGGVDGSYGSNGDLPFHSPSTEILSRSGIL